MALEKNLHLAHALEQWAVWFNNEFAPADLDENGALAFMHHFVDLGVLRSVDEEGKWQLSEINIESDPENFRQQVLDCLETLSRTSAGFAVNFFLGRQPDISSDDKGKPGSAPAKQLGAKVKQNAPKREVASDLSNLQIVKKVGRQLQPFLKFEKETVARLLGPHTQTKEARVIFNFILRHTKTKAEPKKWEQLSRKRHK